MLQQKGSLLDAMETPAEEGKRLQGFDVDGKGGPLEKYSSIVDRFRGASSLADFSNMFN